MKTTMQVLLIWFATLGVLLSLLGFWAGAHERGAARPVSIYTDVMSPNCRPFPRLSRTPSTRFRP
ncbi:MAG: hypothetical protein AABZ48_01260 [candidate division NC10 bacterium]